MGMTVFHKMNGGRGVIETIVHEFPAVAIAYARGGVAQVDALVFNAAACVLLDELGAGIPPAEVELYYDPASNETGVRAWVPDSPMSTCHHVHPTRFLGSGDPRWTNRMRSLWPRKIECPQFLGTWHLPEVHLYRPAPAQVRSGMLVFNPRKLVNP